MAISEQQTKTLGPKRLFTVDEYHRMAEMGILSEDDRVELIAGEIVYMSPIGSYHAGFVIRLVALLVRLVGEQAQVSPQNPIRLGPHFEPQPDVTLLRWRDDYYIRSLPGPEDVLLLVEVSDTTLVGDRAVKVPHYAQAGIAEVWIVNLADQQIEVYSHLSDGAYTQVRSAAHGDSVNIPGFPDLSIAVNDLFGPGTEATQP